MVFWLFKNNPAVYDPGVIVSKLIYYSGCFKFLDFPDTPVQVLMPESFEARLCSRGELCHLAKKVKSKITFFSLMLW